MKKFLKIFLISLASLVLLIAIAGAVVSWLVFTPDKLTPIVRKQAAKYIKCPSEIGEVELTFFSTFPQFGLRANKLTLIHPVPGAPNDTLVDVKELIGIIDISSLINNNELVVSDFRISGGTVHAFTDDKGNTNFDIFGNAASEPDTAQTGLIFKVIDIGNVDLKNIDASYIDESMHLKAEVRRLSAKINGSMKTDDIAGMIDAKPFDITLEYRPDNSSALKTEIRNLSAKIDGSMKSGAVTAAANINPFDIALHYDSDSLKFDTNIQNLSAAIDASTGSDNFSGSIRMEPCKVTFALGNRQYLHDATIRLNAAAEAVLSRQFIRLKEASVSVNDLKLDLAGTVENDTARKSIEADVSYKFASWPIKSIMALIPPAFSSYVKGIEAEGKLSSEGAIVGKYSRLSAPMMDIRVLLEKGALRYADFPIPLTAINADVSIRTDLNDPQSFVRINRFDAKTPKSSVKTAGTITRLFSDMLINLNTDADVVLSEFAPVIPPDMKLTAGGTVSGKVKTEFSMSQITKMQLEKIKASGALTLTDLDVAYDSLSLKTDRSTIEFALPNRKASTDKTRFVFADISASKLEASKINNFKASLRNAEISLEASDVRDTLRIPDILCSFKMDAIRAETDSANISVTRPAGNIAIAPRKSAPGHPEIKLVYNSDLIQTGFGQYSAVIEKLGLDVGAENDPAQKDIVLQWNPKGFFNLEKGIISIPGISYPVEIPGIKMNFEPETFAIEKGNVKIDKSDFNLSGKLNNVSSYFRGDSILKGDFDFISGITDVLQIMNMTNGIGHEEEEKPAETNTGNAPSGPYMVPKGMDILLHTNIGYASYGPNTSASNIKGDIRVHDGILVLDGLTFATPAAEMQLTAMYRTLRKNHLFLGLDFHMLDIEIGELLRMIPAIDSIMPMLRSFGGKGEFHFAVETNLDSLYRLKMSTLWGSASIRGNDLVLMDGETFSEIAKKLKFNKKTINKVDSLSTEFTITKRNVNVYPFLIVMDKYKAVVAGQHNLDMSFKYNISVVQSPLPFRLAVDVKGTPGKLKYSLAKSKFPDFYRPVYRKVVENKQLELRNLIRNTLLENVIKEE